MVDSFIFYIFIFLKTSLFFTNTVNRQYATIKFYLFLVLFRSLVDSTPRSPAELLSGATESAKTENVGLLWSQRGPVRLMRTFSDEVSTLHESTIGERKWQNQDLHSKTSSSSPSNSLTWYSVCNTRYGYVRSVWQIRTGMASSVLAKLLPPITETILDLETVGTILEWLNYQKRYISITQSITEVAVVILSHRSVCRFSVYTLRFDCGFLPF